MFCNCRTFCRRPEHPLSYWVSRTRRAVCAQSALCVLGLLLPLLLRARLPPALLPLCCTSAALSGLIAALLALLLRDQPRPQHAKIQVCIWALLLGWISWCAQLIWSSALWGDAGPSSMFSLACWGQASTLYTYYMLFYLRDALDRERAALNATSFMTDGEKVDTVSPMAGETGAYAEGSYTLSEIQYNDQNSNKIGV
jgi:hypothetical protein